MRDGFATALNDLIARDERVYVLDGDVANSTRVDRVFALHPARVINVGIAEQNMVSVAAGMAAVGLRPIVTTFAAFAVSRCLDQVRVQVAQPGLPVIIVGAYAGLLAGKTGKTHISVDDLSVYRAMPGMRVLAPADDVELAHMLEYAVGADGPTYLRVARDAVPRIVGPDYTFDPSAVVTLTRGETVVVVSTGTQSGRSLAAAEHLAQRGVTSTVVHVPVLKPLPADAILGALSGASMVVTVEENTRIGGLGSAVAELLTAEGSATPLLAIGIDDRFAESGRDGDLLVKYGLDPARVADCVANAVSARASLGRVHG